MARHSVPHGEVSTAGQSNGSPGTPGYIPRHAKTSDSDVPNRSDNRSYQGSSLLRIPRWLGGKR